MAGVSVTYPGGEKKSYSSADAAKADMASRGYGSYTDKATGQSGISTGGSSNNNSSSANKSSGTSSAGVKSNTGWTGPIDFINGGGAGQSGTTFQGGGVLSDIANALGIKPSQYTSGRDMGDGGGPGQSGPTFQGAGVISNAANAIGLSPLPAAGTGTRISNGQLYLGGNDAWDEYTKTLEAADASVPRTATASTGLGAYAPSERIGDRETNLPTSTAGGIGNSGGSGVNTGIDSSNTGPGGIGNSGGGGNPNEDGEEVSRRNAERSQVPTYEAGGMVGPGGVPQRPSTTSLDLPPSLARLLGMPMQSYAEGGMVGPGGVPQRPMTSPMAMNVAQQGGAPVVGMAPPGGQGRPLNFAAIDQQAQQFMQQNPQQVEQIKAEVQKSMAAGEIDAQGLNMFVQVATTALQNPEMWPQLRQVLIRQGMLDAEDVGEEYDQGFLIILYIIGKTMGGGQMTTPSPMGGQPQMEAAPMSAGQAPQMSMSKGGPLPAKSKNPDGSIPINAHEGEYVIPADVTRKLGTDHFDKLIAKTRGVDEKGAQ